ncbi:Variant surface glycoprotein [Trypanosoma congolense IL3000]|uniref:Variant surface glycoprotein n=1 Tax=Trypanosoma congolense (strain IL3000) TaxID=1068625 RepID=F9WBM2_TRYCI|nr:Variant surface glycoprotein [Trypanosoma congolense IL3000]
MFGKMMMLKSIKVMVMVGLVVIGIHADVHVILNSSHFDLLCNVTRATTGLYLAFVEYDELIDLGKMNELGEKINKIFFGSKWSGRGGGIWKLPETFAEKNPKRSEICESTSKYEDVPLPNDSMATTFFCLCTPTSVGKNDLCELKVESKDIWSDTAKDVKKVFAELWGDGFDANVMNKCGSSNTGGDFEVEKNHLTENLNKLKSIFKKSDILGISRITCDESHACARITKNPTWMQKLEEIERLNLTQIRLDAIKQELESKQKIVDESTSSASEYISASQPSPIAESAAEGFHIPEETPKPKTRRAPEEEKKTEQERVSAKIPQNKIEKTEDPIPTPEQNEASGSFIIRQKWLLLAALRV